jgi:lysophospholipase L1-like esterase
VETKTVSPPETVCELVLIGDSIRMGYESSVRDHLAHRSICSPDANGGDSSNVLAHITEWVMAHSPKVVHLNCGLHDLKKPFDAGSAQVGLDEYGSNLSEIFDQILGAGIRLVWASTTPVDEDLHHKNKGFDRFAADVEAYNSVALELSEARDIPVNDLHAVVQTAGPSRLLRDDGVHFTDEGSRLLGKMVSRFVEPLLEIQ